MKYIIASLIGAIIGYFTNWVAIKMLFRPYTEKKILGMKVPFTPGLIPKERGRIAKSVGETVADHLLTEETLIESMSNTNVTESMETWIEKSVVDIIERDNSLKVELQGLLGDGYKDLIKQGNDALVNLIKQEVRNPKFSQMITELIYSKISELLKGNPKNVLKEKLGIELKEVLRDNLDKCIQKEEFGYNLKKFIHNKLSDLENKDVKLNEFVTEEVIANIKVIIFNNRYKIVGYLEELLEEEKYEIKIKKLIESILATQLNPMIAMFVNSSSIFDKLNQGLKEMLKEEEKIVDIVLFINDTLDKFMDVSLKDVLKSMPEEGKNTIANKVCDILINIMNRENLLYFSNMIEEKIYNYKSIEEIITELNIDTTRLGDYLKNGVEGIINSEETSGYIEEISKFIIKKVEDITIRGMLGSKAVTLPKKISEISIKIYSNFVEVKGVKLIKKLDIAQIVEDNINKFDVEYGEKIILDIARKELSAITWLGGLLGGLLGILSPILGNLY